MSDLSHNHFAVLFYLDKLVSYKPSYNDVEQECILRLEKVIENITPNHRLVMVALQDTMVPVELYTHSPKCRVLPIPVPDKADRQRYINHRLDKHEHAELIANLTDGLYLRELDHIIEDVQSKRELASRDVRGLVNGYRVGIQKDHWGELDIKRLDGAFDWFTRIEGVKGQDEAVKKVVSVLCRARAGLSGIASGTTSKPKGVLFFAGPTGTGKTFLAKKLAKFLFGTEKDFIRIDMSEMMEEHSISKLIGSPPGYVGSERGGTLTNDVRERPFSVVLFDEIEKAHPQILDVFLQILDEGRLTDSRGQTVFFSETVIVLTSNVGCRSTDNSKERRHSNERDELDVILNNRQLCAEEKQEAAREHFRRSVQQFFVSEISRPELLNRVGSNIVPFDYIHNEDMQREIVSSHLKRIRDDFEDKFRQAKYRLTVDERVIHYLVEQHSAQMAQFGGRGITNAIEDEVVMVLAPAMLRAEHDEKHDVNFHVKVDGQQLRVELLP